MSPIKFFLNCLFLLIFIIFLIVWFIYWKLFAKKPKPKKTKPKHPVKIIPKYAKNKIYLSKCYKNPWEKRKKNKKLNKNKNHEKSRK